MSSELPHTGPGGSGPKIWVIDRCLYARIPLLTRLFSLFSYDRFMVADRETELLTMRCRWLWFIRRGTTVPFSQVDYVDEEYVESATDPRPFASKDVQQTYTVQVVLKDWNGKLPLFRFSGSTGSHHDGQNSPRQAALAFASVIAQTLGVPDGPPVRRYMSEDGTMLICSECGRRCGPAAVACLYCGGELEKMVTVEDDADLASE